MGTSTNAYLFYGYCWNEEVEFEANIDEAAKAILAERGHVDPWNDYPGRDGAEAWMAQNDAAIDAFHALMDEVKSELGVDWGFHCHHEYSMPYLFIPGIEVTAYRGSPEAAPDTSTVDPSWKPKLDAFLAGQGIEPPEGENQPGWWLASWWG